MMTGEYREKMTARVRTLKAVAIERTYCTEDSIDEVIELYRDQLSPRIGARLVASAWVDPKFKRELLDDPSDILARSGYDGEGSSHPEFPGLKLRVVENTEDVHNLIVCTLCSCYPVALLGPQPSWYKSLEYRAMAVRYPRRVLESFGTLLPAGVSVNVWDSTAETRYMVLPVPPKGMRLHPDNLEQLGSSVTRNMLIGTETL